MIDYGLRRAQNVHWQSLNVTKDQRAAAKGQKACCLWFTGLSGSGKSTVANALESASRRWALTPTFSTATTSATASTATSASPMPTASRTSAASPKSAA